MDKAGGAGCSRPEPVKQAASIFVLQLRGREMKILFPDDSAGHGSITWSQTIKAELVRPGQG